MADRGRLFYASDGLLWEVDPTASISGEPAQADLQPVRMGEMAAEVLELDQQADDGTDRVFIRGSDGAIKAEVFFDGTNTVINPLTGSVDVQGALATDQATIGGTPSERHYDQLASESLGGNSSVSLSVSGYSIYHVDYAVANPSTSGMHLLLRINGDGASTGAYDYWDETGAKQTGQNEWQVMEMESATTINDYGGGIVFRESGGGVGMSHDPTPARRIAGFAQAGIRTTSPLSSLDFSAATGTWDAGTITAYGVS